LEFVKSAMQLNEAQEQKFLEQYDRYDIALKALNDERLAIIEEYAANFDKITDQEADVLVKRSFDFRKKRTALLEKYYELVAKATSKVIAARFLQVESVLQGTADVTIGSSIPLMAK
jgi:sorbitol-specific phosphotransferase system component IIBC